MTLLTFGVFGIYIQYLEPIVTAVEFYKNII